MEDTINTAELAEVLEMLKAAGVSRFSRTPDGAMTIEFAAAPAEEPADQPVFRPSTPAPQNPVAPSGYDRLFNGGYPSFSKPKTN